MDDKRTYDQVATGTFGINNSSKKGTNSPDFMGSITIEDPAALKGKLGISIWEKNMASGHQYFTFTLTSLDKDAKMYKPESKGVTGPNHIASEVIEGKDYHPNAPGYRDDDIPF